MLQEALQKMQKEIGQHPNDGYVRYVGAELIKFVRANPEKAVLFVDEGKSIQGSFSELEKEATKDKRRFIPPDEGQDIILRYFGVDVPKDEPDPLEIGLKIDLDELLL